MPPQIRAVNGAAHTRILGLGVYRPQRVVPNADIVGAIDSSDEWIQTRSGIRNRRFAGDDETVISMSVAAAEQAIRSSGIEAGDVDCVIVATSTYLYQTPAAAPQIAYQLGMRGAAGFDVSAGCAGFCHALSLASDMVRAGSAGHVLVVGVEKLSENMDPTDRSTAFIFADGAGAVIVGPSDTPGIGPVVWGSDGSQYQAIRQEPSWGEFRADSSIPRPVVKMEGTAVFRWAPFTMAPVARKALEKAGVTIDDLDAFIPHQANMRITETMARSLKIPEHVAIARDIVDSGNTSAASVPLAMETLLKNGDVGEGSLALLIAFGAGLSFAAQVVTMPGLAAN
ncbi:beta-ketoacyl-ACP synthase III [Hoyosella altamirensis]|uniref:Beta-ketoacyl-[acyl-carrier-protein] synthase III n=1 Tax=Hoyosella altamirensis TaxID=616997 RepID=A0A839RIM1_9ACTN|nr:beta-ketoacyl-ACP synthase III [Hoyosella altamirensis]MBB3036515.1 3-oxoacyl-[acyl-carrier-protein] synthase-3/beta-ketoacyl ACP synthase [Hoyosella altamirensis]